MIFILLSTSFKKASEVEFQVQEKIPYQSLVQIVKVDEKRGKDLPTRRTRHRKTCFVDSMTRFGSVCKVLSL